MRQSRGHYYVTLATDAERRAVIFVTETREAQAVERLAADLTVHGGVPRAIKGVSIDMSLAYIKGVEAHLPNAHASHVLNLTRRAEQKRDLELKGRRWTLLKDRSRLSDARRADLDALLANLTTKRTAWQYREELREILDRKQINVVRELLRQWCTNVMRSKVEPMKALCTLPSSPHGSREIPCLPGHEGWRRSHRGV